MFQPIWLDVVAAAIVVAAGALVGTLLGWAISFRSTDYTRRPGRDAAAGGATLLLLNVVINVADSHVTYEAGRALGWRGLLLNHKLPWAILVIFLAVSARHLLARRTSHRASALAREELDAMVTSDH